MKILGRILLGILLLIGLFLLYVGISITHGTATDFQPEERTSIKIENASSQIIISDSTLSFIIWNIGYAGLGAQSDFFFDNNAMLHSGEYMVRSSEDLVQKYLALQDQFFKQNSADFLLLQEVDRNSKRSYYEDELMRYAAFFPEHERTFAINYNVKHVPIPVFEPFNAMGKTFSGLASYSRYHAEEATRLQLPGAFDWPKRIFQLDRCIGLHRYPVANGKDLVVLNIHNSAYDSGGFLKAQQMEYFKKIVLSEYEKGNYVLAGGDWNQCPPNFQFDKFMPGRSGRFTQSNIPADFLPSDWTWAYDASTPTNRKVPTKYVEGESFITLIDFFVASPNIAIDSVRGIDLNFQSSDHQPVYLEIALK